MVLCLISLRHWFVCFQIPVETSREAMPRANPSSRKRRGRVSREVPEEVPRGDNTIWRTMCLE